MKKVLITGGARSGKSLLAEELAGKAGGQVLFVATASPGDEEMARRIEDHKKSRPRHWRTLEVPTNVGDNVRENIGQAKTVVVDCVTLLVSNIFGRYADEFGEVSNAALVEEVVNGEIRQLLECMATTPANFIVVTNEVGLGLVPSSKLGRMYRDLLGKANRMLAEGSDEVFLMVAGIPVKVKSGK